MDYPAIISLYLFGNVDGRTLKINLGLDNGMVKYKIEENKQDQFNNVMKGGPVMTFYNSRPTVCCLKDYPLINDD